VVGDKSLKYMTKNTEAVLKESNVTPNFTSTQRVKRIWTISASQNVTYTC